MRRQTSVKRREFQQWPSDDRTVSVSRTWPATVRRIFAQRVVSHRPPATPAVGLGLIRLLPLPEITLRV